MDNLELSVVQIIRLLLLSYLVSSVDPEGGGTVERLMSQRDDLIEAGLSYINSSSINTVSTLTLPRLTTITSSHQISCIINIENWSKWLLGYPVYYFKYGTFHTTFHEREVFPSHREVVITVNNGDSSFTGTSGTIAWELEDLDAHLIVMWSVPYNLNIYNSYFGIGVVQLRSRFSRDMLPYWYKQMIENKQGKTFQRGLGGDHLVYKHEQFFVIGEFERGYHPLLNISLMPWQTKDLSPSIWHKLYLDSLRTTQSAAQYSSCGQFISRGCLPSVCLFVTLAVILSVR